MFLWRIFCGSSIVLRIGIPYSQMQIRHVSAFEKLPVFWGLMVKKKHCGGKLRPLLQCWHDVSMGSSWSLGYSALTQLLPMCLGKHRRTAQTWLPAPTWETGMKPWHLTLAWSAPDHCVHTWSESTDRTLSLALSAFQMIISSKRICHINLLPFIHQVNIHIKHFWVY